MYDNILFGCSGVEVVVSPERETTSVGVGRALDAVPPRSRTRPAARPEKPVWGRTTVNSDKESGRKQHDRSRGAWLCREEWRGKGHGEGKDDEVTKVWNRER